MGRYRRDFRHSYASFLMQFGHSLSVQELFLSEFSDFWAIATP